MSSIIWWRLLKASTFEDGFKRQPLERPILACFSHEVKARAISALCQERLRRADLELLQQLWQSWIYEMAKGRAFRAPRTSEAP